MYFWACFFSFFCVFYTSCPNEFKNAITNKKAIFFWVIVWYYLLSRNLWTLTSWQITKWWAFWSVVDMLLTCLQHFQLSLDGTVGMWSRFKSNLFLRQPSTWWSVLVSNYGALCCFVFYKEWILGAFVWPVFVGINISKVNFLIELVVQLCWW